jgi:predicted transcriptional regulator
LIAVKTLAIQVPDEVATAVEEAAVAQKVSVERFVRDSIQEKLARDAQFDEAAGYVLNKNAELYDRLS